ncbi:hypothetical protein PIB30_114378, partial [Stylosanthes scabra]|nr:hypothetical protein [Stylosanthes scabra]
MEETIHVAFDESNSNCSRKDICDDDFADSLDSLTLDGEEKEKETIEASTKDNEEDQIIESTSQEQTKVLPREWRTTKDHPLDNVIGDVTKG